MRDKRREKRKGKRGRGVDNNSNDVMYINNSKVVVMCIHNCKETKGQGKGKEKR